MTSLKDDLFEALDDIKAHGSADLSCSETKYFRHTLRKWLEEPEDSRKNGLYYVLDHVYTEPSDKLSPFHGSDLVVGQVLDNLSKELDFEVFFALLEKEEIGYPEVDHSKFYDVYREDSEEESEEESYHFMQDVFDTTHQAKTVRDMHGKPVVDGLELDPYEDIIQAEENVYNDVFDGAYAEERLEDETADFRGDSESTSLSSGLEYGEANANVPVQQGPSLTHWYRVSVSVSEHHTCLSLL